MNCPTCEQPVGELRDEASRKEASISGLCQGCQDDYFGPDNRSVRRTAAVVEEPAVDEVSVEEVGGLPSWITDSQDNLG